MKDKDNNNTSYKPKSDNVIKLEVYFSKLNKEDNDDSIH